MPDTVAAKYTERNNTTRLLITKSTTLSIHDLLFLRLLTLSVQLARSSLQRLQYNLLHTSPLPLFLFALFSWSFILQPSLSLRRRYPLRWLIPLRRLELLLRRCAPWSLHHVAGAWMLRLDVWSVTAAPHTNDCQLLVPPFHIYMYTCSCVAG